MGGTAERFRHFPGLHALRRCEGGGSLYGDGLSGGPRPGPGPPVHPGARAGGDWSLLIALLRDDDPVGAYRRMQKISAKVLLAGSRPHLK